MASLLLGGCVPTAEEVKPDRALDLTTKGALAVSLTSSGIPYLYGLQFFYKPPGGGEEVAVIAYGTDSLGYWSDYYGATTIRRSTRAGWRFWNYSRVSTS